MSVYEESDEYCPHCDNHYVSRCDRHLGGTDLPRTACSFWKPRYLRLRLVLRLGTPVWMLGVYLGHLAI